MSCLMRFVVLDSVCVINIDNISRVSSYFYHATDICIIYRYGNCLARMVFHAKNNVKSQSPWHPIEVAAIFWNIYTEHGSLNWDVAVSLSGLCYQHIAKPCNKTATSEWWDGHLLCNIPQCDLLHDNSVYKVGSCHTQIMITIHQWLFG